MRVVRDTDLGRLLTRRALIVGGLQVGLFGLLFSRLYSLQIAQGGRFRTLADENRISTRLVLPERGRILDRNGTVLAMPEKNFRADLLPEQTPDIRATLQRLFSLLNFEPAEQQRILKDIKRSHSRLPVLLRDNIDWETLALLELYTPELPGVMIEAGEVRNYPFKENTAHIVGYVGAPTDQEAGDDALLNEPGFRIGKSGVEKFYEENLQGEPGSVQLEVNAYGQQVRELTREESTSGEALKLSLDINLQEFAQNRLLQERSASAIIMDALDGGIYAMASHPSFDPNLFSYGITKENWGKMNSDSLTPLFNKTLTGTYAPGSTFKVVVALAALEDGVNPHTHVFCPGYMDLGNHRFHCWKKGGHGGMDMHNGIVQSCDVFFYHLGQKVGIDKIAEMAARLGLGAKTGIDLPHEKPGLIPNSEWKKKQFTEGWQPGETLVAAIGQGYILATPLQMAVATARISSGLKIAPHIIHPDSEAEKPVFAPLGLKPSSLAFIRDAMIGVVSPGGTAAASRIGVPGYEMGGKTGTSQVRRITRAQRARGVPKNEDRPWEERDHALFIAFAPSQNPRYVATVVVEHGGGGSKAAAPIARELLIETMKRDPAKTLPAPLVMPVSVKPVPAPEEDEELFQEDEELPGAVGQ
ncbi:MAG: penicillin-binding protein 2 [Proteobacteria bacterium]|nr:penicillin-binding protein 2 [Pseudomonadota bacterium]